MGQITGNRVDNRPVPELGLMQTNTKVGVEIEIATSSNRSAFNGNYWTTVSEGSIQGFEIVLLQPQGGSNLVAALEQAERSVAQLAGNNKFPEMTSVHAHIDIRDMTPTQLINFLTLSIMLENVLYNYVEPHRSKNHFCLPMSDATECLQKLRSFVSYHRQDNLSRDRVRSLFHPDALKYAGINLSSIPRYGSLEFRMHHGTANSTDLIRWINILLKIKEYAMGDGRSPTNILETKIELGISTIFEQVLGHYSEILRYEGIEDDILDGIRNAQDFVSVYSVPIGRNVNGDIPNRSLPLFSNYREWYRENHNDG